MDIEIRSKLHGEKLHTWQRFLANVGLTPDTNLEQTILFWDSETLVATGSRNANLLKCIAVDPTRRGEGLLAGVLTALRREAFRDGHRHLFLYTKPENIHLFTPLFFYPVAQTDRVLLMEDKQDGIAGFLESLSDLSSTDFLVHSSSGKIGSIVMNCDPFTLGHQYLAETAAAQCDHLYIFVLSEDKGRFPAADRLLMAKLGTAHLPNVTVLPTGPYLISSSTFPTYFLKDRDNADEIQCMLDIEIFCQHFVPKFGITHRFVGTEPLSPMTNRYNEALSLHLPSRDIELCVIPRREIDDTPVSASAVRAAFDVGDTETVQKFVPKTTFEHIYRQQSKETLQ